MSVKICEAGCKNMHAAKKIELICEEIVANYLVCKIGIMADDEFIATFHKGAMTELRGLFKLLTSKNIEDILG